LPDFLQQKLEPKDGNVWEVPREAAFLQEPRHTLEEQAKPFDFHPKHAEKRGRHRGAHYYTVGQRKGLNIGGSPLPLFVLGVNTQYNAIYVGQGDDHPGLYRKALFITAAEEHWVRPDRSMQPGETAQYSARIRYRQPLVPVTLHKVEEGLYMEFETPEKAITPGQFAAWYDGEELIGSGIIAE